MEHTKINIGDKNADAYIIPLGPVNLVAIVTDKGMIACGGFNAASLGRSGVPVAIIKAPQGPVAVVDDLLDGTVWEVNPPAEELGIRKGLSGKDAMEKL